MFFKNGQTINNFKTMKIYNLYRVTLLMFLISFLTSCQVNNEEVLISPNPSSQRILNSIKGMSQYNNYLETDQKIQELMPQIISNTTKEQKFVYNNIINKYTNKFDMFKTKDLELVSSILDITKPVEDLRNTRLSIIKSIHSNLLKIYPSLTFNEVALILNKDAKANARISSCSSDAYAASWNAFEYALQVYGDPHFAYIFADWVYSKTYMSCLDPIGRGEGMAMA